MLQGCGTTDGGVGGRKRGREDSIEQKKNRAFFFVGFPTNLMAGGDARCREKEEKEERKEGRGLPLSR